MTSSPSQWLTLALVQVLLCAVGAVLSGLGTRFGWWDFRVGFIVLRWSVYLLAVPAILAVASVWRAGGISAGPRCWPSRPWCSG